MFAGMAAVMTLGASAQTLTEEWRYTENIPGSSGGGDMRDCTVLDGKLLVSNKADKKIIFYDGTNQGADYLTGLTNGGTAITVDEAGNIIYSVNWYTNSSKQLAVIPAGGGDVVTVDITYPDGAYGRNDFLGKVLGNVLSPEGGYVFVPRQNTNVVDIVKIAEGVQISDFSLSSASTGVNNSAEMHAEPIPGLTVADLDAMAEDDGDLSQSFVLHYRGASEAIYSFGKDDEGNLVVNSLALTSPDSAVTAKGASSCGFATFALQGKTYYVCPVTSDGTNRTNLFGVFDETGALVANVPVEDMVLANYVQNFAVEPCDENSVFIYYWFPSKQAAKYKFSVAAATPAAPVLVTTNPENGAKVTSLEGIVLEFDQNVTVDTSMGNEAVWVMNADSEQMVAQGQLLPGQLAMTQARAILDTPVTNAGNYKVIITSGLISGADGGKNAEIVLNYTIESQGGDEWVFTPASGSTVTSLSSITLDNTSTSFMVSWSGTAQLTDAEGNVVATVTDPENYFESETAMESFRAILPLDTEITTPGTYTLTVPAGYFLVGSDWQSMQNSPELTATYTIEAPAAPLYAVGPWQNWDAANPSEFEYANGLYTLTMGTTEAPVSEFKMSTTKNSAEAPGDWNNGFNIGVICVANDQLVTAGQEFPLYVGGNANITFASADVWVVTVDLVNKTISAESGAVVGIEDVEVEAAEAVYYNLQGVQVAADALTPGMYVKVAGKTATKVVVK